MIYFLKMCSMHVVILFTLFINLAVSNRKINQNINFEYRGLIAPVFTPFNNDENRSLNVSIIPKYAEFLASKNVTGVLISGTVGEDTCMTVDERKKLAEAWASTVKKTKQHLMINIGGTDLNDIKKLALHAERIGADSLLVLPDLYVKPTTTEDVIDYLQLISEFAPRTPLLYYHNTQYQVNINIGKFLTNVGTKVPTFVGMKHLTTDFEELMKSANSNYTIFVGTDLSSLGGCVLGIDSFITTTLNFIPELSSELLHFCNSKYDIKRTREAQNTLNKIFYEIISYGDFVVTMKAATNMITNLPLGPPRAPRKMLSKEDLKSMSTGLSKLGFKIKLQ